jgi:hypothetical protein
MSCPPRLLGAAFTTSWLLGAVQDFIENLAALSVLTPSPLGGCVHPSLGRSARKRFRQREIPVERGGAVGS